jgi:hypothetical protein
MRNYMVTLLMSVAMLTSANVLATDVLQKFGAWDVVAAVNGKLLVARTATVNNEWLYYYCEPVESQCIFTVESGKSCKKNQLIPMLGNVDTSSVALSGFCEKDSKEGYFIMQSAAHIKALTGKNGVLNVAFGMEYGNYSVLQFQLNGATEAIKFIDDNFKNAQAAKKL